MPAWTGPALRIPLSLLSDRRLPRDAKYIYIILLSRAGPNRTCVLRQPELLHDSEIRSPHTLRTHLRALTAAGWLRVQRGKGHESSVYELLNPHEVTEQDAIERVRIRLQRESFKGEALMREYLNLLVASDDFQDNARPGFLAHPLTGERLEYDRWYPVGVAFEFQGPQHYGPTELYPDPDEARRRQERDLVKEGLSTRAGVKLVLVHATDLTLDRMRKKVEGLLPLRDPTGHEALVRFLENISRRYIARTIRGRVQQT